MKKAILIAAFILPLLFSLRAQMLQGVVLEKNIKGDLSPLIGASVYWAGTTIGVTTDTIGVFKIKPDSISKKLVVSYIGYISDTILISKQIKIKVVLDITKNLKEVEIVGRENSIKISSLDPIKTQLMTGKELVKAACCNLSESFETNPSVDVSYSDAISGAKQIQMLGLSGIYTQLTSENLPGIRGLASSYGLAYVPGSWIEGIQVIKGTGSVANGYESIAGQINVELKKPDEKSDKLFFNVYGNDMGKTEANVNFTQKINEHLYSSLMLHGNYFNNRMDINRDGFIDAPIGSQVNILNRWKYENAHGLEIQWGVKTLRDDKMGGQMAYDPKTDYLKSSKYGLEINTQRLEGFGKIGYVFPQSTYKSIGFMFSALDHQQNSYFGYNIYNGRQQTIYGNLIYQSIIGNTHHKFRTGLSYVYDKYNESLTSANYKRTESVPGTFYEYTYSGLAGFTLVSGLRGDYNNLYGLIVTPRINAKYDLSEKTILRVSAGRGQRTANVFAENSSAFASSRQIQIITNTNSLAGLKPEIAWNEGLNLTHNFRLNYHDGSIGLDFYRTDFVNQVVVDLDKDPQKILFYNLKGKSFSSSFQAEVNYELIKNLDVRLAYRWYDVKTTYSDVLMEKSLTAQNRAFANFAYEYKKLKFDYTINWNGKKRIPETSSNPINYRINNYSPTYFIMNAQVTKAFGKNFDLYLGMENITNYTQHNLIIAADQPFGNYFDSSLIWGPVSGRMTYFGFRYKLL